MHRRLTRVLLLALLVVAVDTAAQARPTKVAAVNAAMAFRVNWMGDATPFNACSIYQVTDRPSDFPEGISPPLHRALDRATANPCENQPPGVPGAWTPHVVVDSVIVAGDSAGVFVTVRKGEISYLERYSVVAVGGGRWSAREVRVWGAMREYPVRTPVP